MELLGVGAAEALVILVITLIVVGPNRFPEIARQGGRYYRMARRYAAEVTADVRGAMQELESEVEAQQEEFKAAHDEIAKSITSSISETRDELESLGRETQEAITDSEPTAAGEPPATNGSGGLLAPRELPAAGSTPETDEPERRTEGD